MDFVGRTPELDLLDSLWQSEQPEFLFLPGRRRVGKTELIYHWLETRRPENSLYWVAENDSSASQLASFSQEVYSLGAGRRIEGSFTFGNWRQAFEEIARAADQQRVVVVIDEFTYLLASDRSAGSALQHAWDSVLSKANLFLIVTGSHMGLMNDVSNRNGPLYSRPTAEHQLLPLPFSVTRQFFPEWVTPEDRVLYYTCFGGVPGYWRQADPERGVMDNIYEIFIKKKFMASEAETMLYDFVQETHNYASILRAIANGALTLQDIANYSGIANTSLPKYINILISAGYVQRKKPLTRKTGKNSRYKISDPPLRFQYRFFRSHGAQLARGINQHVIEDIEAHLPLFVGKHTWEEICRDWVWHAGNNAVIPMPLEVGSTWTRQAQIDLVGINPRESKLILGEAKWTQAPEPRRTIEDLAKKIPLVLPAGKKSWEITLLGMSKSGWRSTALEFVEEFNAAKQILDPGGQWKVEKILLRDFSTIDQELDEWESQNISL